MSFVIVVFVNVCITPLPGLVEEVTDVAERLQVALELLEERVRTHTHRHKYKHIHTDINTHTHKHKHVISW